MNVKYMRILFSFVIKDVRNSMKISRRWCWDGDRSSLQTVFQHHGSGVISKTSQGETSPLTPRKQPS